MFDRHRTTSRRSVLKLCCHSVVVLVLVPSAFYLLIHAHVYLSAEFEVERHSQQGEWKYDFTTKHLPHVEEEAIDSFWNSLLRTELHVQKKSVSMSHAWPSTAERNLSVYIRPHVRTALILPSSPCAARLLILVQSSVKGYHSRSVIRQTWASRRYLPEMSETSVLVRFVVGKSSDPGAMQALRIESNLYQDILQEDFMDVYSNLTLKIVFSLKWVLSACAAQYILKCDEDVFINVPNLLALISKKGGNSMWVMGRLVTRAAVVRDSESKYYTPLHMYSGSVYPMYTNGPAYLLDYSAASAIYRRSLQVPLLHMEDVFITGVCAESEGIARVNSDLFHPFCSVCDEGARIRPDFCGMYDLVSCHSLSASQMMAVWKQLEWFKSSEHRARTWCLFKSLVMRCTFYLLVVVCVVLLLWALLVVVCRYL